MVVGTIKWRVAEVSLSGVLASRPPPHGREATFTGKDRANGGEGFLSEDARVHHSRFTGRLPGGDRQGTLDQIESPDSGRSLLGGGNDHQTACQCLMCPFTRTTSCATDRPRRSRNCEKPRHSFGFASARVRADVTWSPSFRGDVFAGWCQHVGRRLSAATRRGYGFYRGTGALARGGRR